MDLVCLVVYVQKKVMPMRAMNGFVTKGGFTLVEVMIASIILVIVSSGIMAGIISALKAQANASDYYRATCVARNRVQHAKTISFTSLSLLSETNRIIDGEGNLTEDGDYLRTTLVSNAAGTNWGVTNWQVTVRVWYPVSPGQLSDQPVQVQTMLTKEM